MYPTNKVKLSFNQFRQIPKIVTLESREAILNFYESNTRLVFFEWIAFDEVVQNSAENQY